MSDLDTCMICLHEIPDGAPHEELGALPVCMDCWHLFFAADDEPQAETETEAQ